MDTRHIPTERLGSTEVYLPRGRTIIAEQNFMERRDRQIELNHYEGIIVIVAKVESYGTSGPQQITSLKFAYVEDERGDS